MDQLPTNEALKHATTDLPPFLTHSEALSFLDVHGEMSNVCLALRPPATWFLPGSCADNSFLWSVFDALEVSSRVRQTASRIVEHMRRLAPSEQWSAILLNDTPTPASLLQCNHSLPLYAACNGCHDTSSLDVIPLVVQLRDVIGDENFSREAISAVELQVCLAATFCYGTSSLAISHLISALRERERRSPAILFDSRAPNEDAVLVRGLRFAFPAGICDEAFVNQLNCTKKSLRSAEALRRMRGAGNITHTVRTHPTPLICPQMLHALFQGDEARRILAELRFPYESEKRVLEAFEFLRNNLTDAAADSFSKALTVPASIRAFGLSLRRFIATEGSLSSDLDKYSPDLRTRIVNHFPFLEETKMLLFSHNLEIQGAPLCLLQLAQFLTRCGVTLSVVSPYRGPLKEILEALGANVIVSPSFVISHSLGTFDVIVLNTLETWWAMGSIPARFHARVVWWVHESARAEYWKQYPALQSMFPKARKHIFVTKLSKANFAGIALQDAEVIHNGVPMHAIETEIRLNSRAVVRRKLGLNERHFVITLIGSVNHQKNQLDFVRAAKWILSHYTGPLQPHFLLVGFSGEIAEYEQEVLDFVEAEGLSQNVRFLCKAGDVLPFFAASDAYATPSLVESFGRTVIEAMALSVPVVAYASDGIPEVLQDGTCGRLVPVGAWQQLAVSLIDVLRNPMEAAHLGLRGRRCATEHYSEQRMVERLALVLDEVAYSTKQASFEFAGLHGHAFIEQSS